MTTTNYQRTKDWLTACGKTPSPEAASVQIGCHIEEFCEFLDTLRTDKEGYAKLIDRCKADLEWFARKLKCGDSVAYIPPHLREQCLDALCDTEVTGNGVAYLLGMNKPEADAAVLDSNDAKLIDGKPVILAGGKIGKPEGWQAPDLSRYV
jgi:predicted HAD superfamily Cof-like phosphohydrolase